MKKFAIFIPTLLKGGTEKQAVLLANVLSKKGKVFFILLYPELGLDKELLKLLEFNNIEHILLQGAFFIKIKKLYQLFKKEKVYVLFCYLTLPNLLGSVIGKLAGVKIIFQGIRSSFLPKKKILVEKVIGWFSNGIIINNYIGMKEFSHLGFKNMILIHNCFLNPNLPIYRELKYTIKIISIGRFSKEKDYLTALKAISYLKQSFRNFKYSIVGYGFLIKEIRDIIDELLLSDNVEILENPNNIDLLLRDADIFLLSSLYEGTSNSIMEAMNATLPIVTTNVGDNIILVENEKSGFLTNVGDFKAIANALLKLSINYDLRIRMGKRSNEILREKFSIEKFKESYFKLI